MTSDSSIFRMTITTDNEATETVSKVTLTTTAVNIVQINGTNTSTKVSIGEGNCICWYNKCTQHLKAEFFFLLWLCILLQQTGASPSWVLNHIESVHVCQFLGTVNIINPQFMRNKLNTIRNENIYIISAQNELTFVIIAQLEDNWSIVLSVHGQGLRVAKYCQARLGSMTGE